MFDLSHAPHRYPATDPSRRSIPARKKERSTVVNLITRRLRHLSNITQALLSLSRAFPRHVAIPRTIPRQASNWLTRTLRHADNCRCIWEADVRVGSPVTALGRLSIFVHAVLAQKDLIVMLSYLSAFSFVCLVLLILPFKFWRWKCYRRIFGVKNLEVFFSFLFYFL